MTLIEGEDLVRAKLSIWVKHITGKLQKNLTIYPGTKKFDKMAWIR
jgi:hypothetical protein